MNLKRLNKLNLIKKGRQAYLIQLEGSSVINDEEMASRDGMEIYEDRIEIKTHEQSQFILIEMALASDNHQIE